MSCPQCKSDNEADAVFCTQCGAALSAGAGAAQTRNRKAYLSALFLVPVILIAVGFGYYKYFLPRGVAAVINGEEITVAELDAAVFARGSDERVNSKFRYQVLNQLISERLILQEARRTDLRVSPKETEAALAQARSSMGMTEDAFSRHAAAAYGSMQAYEAALKQNLLINKFLHEKVVPPGASPEKAEQTINRWMQGLSGRASVRITLAEQMSGASCGCCNNRGSAWASENKEKSKTTTGVSPGSTNSEKASAAALAYWLEKYNTDDVATDVKDFGCHQEIDIIKDNKKIGSLSYRGGKITER